MPPFMDISIPETPALSAAVPLIVYGVAEAMLRVAPFAGSLIVDVGAPISAVVYENTWLAVMGLPATSVTDVETVTV